MQLSNRLSEYARACFTGIWIQSHEHQDALTEIATHWLRSSNERVSRIVEDLKDEKIERLEGIRDGLLSEERQHYWEFTDRGVNFAYLVPERRQYLDPLLELVAPGRQRFRDETRNV